MKPYYNCAAATTGFINGVIDSAANNFTANLSDAIYEAASGKSAEQLKKDIVGDNYYAVSGYHVGKVFGDTLSTVGGVLETIIGCGIATGGGAATIATAGTASGISVPITVGGVAIAAHGTTTITTSAGNIITDVRDARMHYSEANGNTSHDSSEGESGTKRFALGIDDYGLDDFAAKNGAETYKNYDPEMWKSTVLDKLADPDTEVLVNLDGVDSPWAAVQRVSRGGGGATDWELFQIKTNPEWWDNIKWFENGVEVPNPFK